jgi:hypothetical protein
MITAHKKHFIARCDERGYSLSEAMPCVVATEGDMWTIDERHPAYPRRRTESSGHLGPGTELKALLAKIGIHASPTCGCNKMAKQMDVWGQESLNHIEEIVDVMEETAKMRKLPFLRTAGRILVRQACRIARKKGNK